VPSISKSNQYASSDLACYFSSSDLVMIYIRNLNWNLSNYSTKTNNKLLVLGGCIKILSKTILKIQAPPTKYKCLNYTLRSEIQRIHNFISV
jgi:hypothetical protein